MLEHVNESGRSSSGKLGAGQDGRRWSLSIEGPLRILLIKPDDAHRRELAANLRACGLPTKLREARGFVAGLAALRVDTYDCVFLARDLPDGDALALVGLLRSTEAAATPVIFVLADEDEAFESAALEAGAEDTILRADAHDRDLRRTIRAAVARSALKGDLARANARLERIAVNDPLTGLLNRRGLELALKREQAMGRRKGVDNHMLLVDLDDFKRINDNHGYDVGDRMLQEVARALEETARRTDHVARIGGDEFLLLMPDSKLAAGLRLAERIRQRLESVVLHSARGGLTVSASLGVSRVPAEARTVTDLVAEVGGAVHRSKRGGKNRVSAETNRQVTTTGRITTLADDLDVDLSRPLFLSQPIGDLQDGEVHAHWVMAPGSPLASRTRDADASLAEQSTMAVAGDRHHLQAAVVAARAADDGACRFYFSVHPATLLQTPTAHLRDVFADAEQERRWSLMISDDLLLGDPGALTEPALRLREAGIGLGIRQVGFSRDSLEAVVLLRPTLVTLRLAHLMGPTRNQQRIGMIRRLVRTLEVLVPDVVLEGVVHDADHDLAAELGIRYGIGSGVGGVTVLTSGGG